MDYSRFSLKGAVKVIKALEECKAMRRAVFFVLTLLVLQPVLVALVEKI